MNDRQPFRAEAWPRSCGKLPLDYVARRCRPLCWKRLAVSVNLSGRALCPDCHARWQKREANRIAGAAALAEAKERLKAKWHAIGRGRIAATMFEPWPDQDRF
jgi:hypothetical protein